MVHRAEHSRRRMGLCWNAAALVSICIGIGKLSRTHLCRRQSMENFVHLLLGKYRKP